MNKYTKYAGYFRIDGLLLFFLAALCCFGLFILYSASGQNMNTIYRQLVFLGIGWFAMLAVTTMDARSIARATLLFYVIGVAMLVAVEFFGITSKGAQRWLDFPGIPKFQPSEFMKWIVPLTVASYLSRQDLPPKLIQVLVVMAILFLPVFLIMQQPDLGTAILLAVAGLAVLFLAGWRWLHISIFSLIVLTLLPLIWRLVLHDYQRSRILVLLFPNADPLGAGWNITQSKAAIGSGGVWGKGWLEGTQSQLQFLPEGDTDFIVAVLAEELGLLGVLSLLTLYLLILWRCVRLSLHAPDNFGRLFSGTLSLIFVLFIFINIGMVSGLLPVVGVPLPLISRGGSSSVAILLAFGLLMSVSSTKGRIQ